MASFIKKNKLNNLLRTQQRRMGKNNSWNLHCELPGTGKVSTVFFSFAHFPLQRSGERRPLIFCFHLQLLQELLWLQTIRPDWHFYAHSHCALQKGNWALPYILLLLVPTTSHPPLLSGLYSLKTLGEVCLIRNIKHFSVTD